MVKSPAEFKHPVPAIDIAAKGYCTDLCQPDIRGCAQMSTDAAHAGPLQ